MSVGHSQQLRTMGTNVARYENGIKLRCSSNFNGEKKKKRVVLYEVGMVHYFPPVHSPLYC